VGVAAADFHQPVLPLGVGETADLVNGFGDQLRVPEFVKVLHVALD
jgi:hypothetical protein